jgi:hypothetical protein
MRICTAYIQPFFFHSTELGAQKFTGEKLMSFQGQELPFKSIPEECRGQSITVEELDGRDVEILPHPRLNSTLL